MIAVLLFGCLATNAFLYVASNIDPGTTTVSASFDRGIPDGLIFVQLLSSMTCSFVALFGVFASLYMGGQLLADRSITTTEVLWSTPVALMLYALLHLLRYVSQFFANNGALHATPPDWLTNAVGAIGIVEWVALCIVAIPVYVWMDRRRQCASTTIAIALPANANLRQLSRVVP